MSLDASHAAMVDTLAKEGNLSLTVQQAMGKVPRHRFAPRFWAMAPDTIDPASAQLQEWHVDDATTDPQVLSLIHDVGRALALRLDDGVPPRVTSTISAPQLVAWTLERLELAPGMRVLEIGTGSGYNAALLAELVGAAGKVVTVEIDSGLADAARPVLANTGYGSAQVITGDGYYGAPGFGQFDRVVATVGCTDVAPAWLEQLRPDGFALIPLVHGGLHPTVKVEAHPDRARGSVIGHSGFVAVMGHQASAGPWRLGASVEISGDPETLRLPAELAATMPPADPGAPPSRTAMDLAYFLALEDERAAFYCALTDGQHSLAALDPAKHEVAMWGPAGRALCDSLISIAMRWVALGAPIATEFQSAWIPRTGTQRERQPGRWRIPRLDYDQLVELPSAWTS